MTNIHAELSRQQGNVQENRNSAILRFSRRMRESLKGPNYADCFELPSAGRAASAVMFSLVFLLATVSALIVAMQKTWLY